MSCAVSDCGVKPKARGLCNKHYQRWLKYGDPYRVAYVRPPAGTSVADRFWSKVEKTETCWLWTASRRAGYGSFGIGGRRTTVAHRWSYEQLVGPVPDGLVLDHLCRVRHCVNPAHLEPVTRGENSLRGESPNVVAYREGRCLRGHELTAENTVVDSLGRRRCRTCKKAQSRGVRGVAA